MLVDPPIDKLVEKVGNKYALVGLLSKRARNLMESATIIWSKRTLTRCRSLPKRSPTARSRA